MERGLAEFEMIKDGKGNIWVGEEKERKWHTPISASSFTDSRIVTWWFGFTILVEIPAERPARPAPMIIRWIDIWVFRSFDGKEVKRRFSDWEALEWVICLCEVR